VNHAQKYLWKLISVGFLIVVIIIYITAYLDEIPEKPGYFPKDFDTIMHFILYGLFSFSLHLASGKKHWRRIPVFPAIILFIATTDEFIQILSPNRSFEYSDMLANFGGIALFYVISIFLHRKTT
jgi:VanZ family protein